MEIFPLGPVLMKRHTNQGLTIGNAKVEGKAISKQGAQQLVNLYMGEGFSGGGRAFLLLSQESVRVAALFWAISLGLIVGK